MTIDRPDIDADDGAVLRRIAEGTATATGERFFGALVESMKGALGTAGAWIAVYDEPRRELRALAMQLRQDWHNGFVYPIDGTPCQTAIEERRPLHVPERVIELYKRDPQLVAFGAVSYMGVPLFDNEGHVIGHMAVLDDKPMPPAPRAMAIFQIFASRAAAELQRLQAERATRDREAQLSRLVDTAMDAVINLNEDFGVVLMNPAARRIFDCRGAPLSDLDFRQLLTPQSAVRLQDYVKQLDDSAGSPASLWVAGGLDAVTGSGRQFQVEATLSRYESGQRRWFTLILRDVEDRRQAERRIQSLQSEASYLREELKQLQNFEQILGSSKTMLHALHEVEQVAATDTTVLLLGETGTGKELFARALHAASRRADKPLIKVNCGAIPSNLIESELFGHEKGAFTGATARREGRFQLADGGTIFLDEVGELPLDLQPKLLRVLQEGEFEVVGSSKTCRVDARVVAATNRDLAQCVRDGTFREDLFYRLNVFPIRIPPLRERREDIAELARTFADRFSRRVGRRLNPLSDAVLDRLRGYAWPGNVRELQNVIERGVIVSKNGEFDIQRALPDVVQSQAPPSADDDGARILNSRELEELERHNIQRALEATRWKVSGAEGAARLLGLKPSTLSSRMRALGIRRPAS